MIQSTCKESQKEVVYSCTIKLTLINFSILFTTVVLIQVYSYWLALVLDITPLYGSIKPLLILYKLYLSDNVY